MRWSCPDLRQYRSQKYFSDSNKGIFCIFSSEKRMRRSTFRVSILRGLLYGKKEDRQRFSWASEIRCLSSFFCLQRKYLCFGNDFLDLLDQMRMAGEKQNLMGFAKLTEGVERIEASIGVEVDKDVIEHNRQGIDMVCVFANQRQPHRQI